MLAMTPVRHAHAGEAFAGLFIASTRLRFWTHAKSRSATAIHAHPRYRTNAEKTPRLSNVTMKQNTTIVERC